MRRSFYLLSILAFVSSAAFVSAGCSIGKSDGSGAGSGGNPPGNSSSTDPNNPTAQPDAPLTARSVCGTVATDAKFGQGCSGSGSGSSFCAISDPQCGTETCVFDERTEAAFSVYCSQKCSVGDVNNRCPLGYECAAQTGSCDSADAQGYCAQSAGSGCSDVKVDPNSKFFDGPGGAFYEISSTYGTGSDSTSKGTLSIRKGDAFQSITSWDGDASMGAIVRTADSVLLVLSTYEVFIKGETATAIKRDTASSSEGTYGTVYSVATDGSIVSLNATSSTDAYAALSRRADDGTWTDVGPTQQRISKIAALGQGFVAECQKALCASADGQNFKTVALPPNVTFDDKTVFSVAGASADDFFFTTAGAVYHQRKGNWVLEGPHADAPSTVDAGSGSGSGSGSGTSYSYPDVLRSFSDGTVVFHTWHATDSDLGSGSGAYSTYVYSNDCWAYSPPGSNLESRDLVKGLTGDVFVSTSDDNGLCTTPAH